MRAQASVHDVRLQAPLRPTGAGPASRPLVLLRVVDGDGVVGHGEAAPLENYDGVSVEQVLEALDAHTSVLAMNEWPTISDAWAACAAVNPIPQALAAVDLALWDLAGRRAGRSVTEVLGEVSPAPIPVNATIGAVDPRAAAEEALAARESGFGCVKVKVGTPDDRQRLAAIRDAIGPDMLIRVDANGAWTQLDAPERIRALSRFDIELFEEPVHGGGAIEHVAHVVPRFALALDESASANLGPHARRLCTAVCLKIASSGGITGLLAEAKRARELGYEVYIASTLDGPLGIAAALHAAAVVKPDRHCGLATLGRFNRPNPLPAVGGHMQVPAAPGLGTGLAEWYV
jgi:L-Ala-D/L-Glu epimerase